jgi:hypothetical protein
MNVVIRNGADNSSYLNLYDLFISDVVMDDRALIVDMR